jgi:hypothetical protein
MLDDPTRRPRCRLDVQVVRKRLNRPLSLAEKVRSARSRAAHRVK